MRHVKWFAPVLTALLALVAVSSAWADVETGLTAYHDGNYDEAYKNFVPEAEKGNALAQTALGIMYQNGRGVKRDYQQARVWYEKAAEQGDEIAENNLGFMYWKGQGGTRDAVRAAELFSKATLQGYGLAAYHLADMHRTGEGVAKNLLRAYVLYTFAKDTLTERQQGKAEMRRQAIGRTLSEEDLRQADVFLAALRKARKERQMGAAGEGGGG